VQIRSPILQIGNKSVTMTDCAASQVSGTDAMFSVAGAIESLADQFVESPSGSSNLSTPQRRSAAINLLEEDDDLSDNEQVQAIRLFSQCTAVANSYIAIKKKTTHTCYIQSELSEF
jgi:hypothetical protein